jgi:hypothetical protein
MKFQPMEQSILRLSTVESHNPKILIKFRLISIPKTYPDDGVWFQREESKWCILLNFCLIWIKGIELVAIW